MSGKREAVRKAIEESEAEACTPAEVHLPDLSDGPLEDRCACCRVQVMRHDRAWQDCRSTWGLVFGANYCDCDCLAEAMEHPVAVAKEMRSRPGWTG